MGLYSFKYFSPGLEKVFETFLTTDSNAGLFFIVIFAALTIGLIITTFRWLIFERLFCRSERLTSEDFASIGADENKLNAFRASVDEYYRYHQFWGNMTFVIPIFAVGWLVKNFKSICFFSSCLWVIGAIVIEIITGMAAIESFKRYVRRGKIIIGG